MKMMKNFNSHLEVPKYTQTLQFADQITSKRGISQKQGMVATLTSHEGARFMDAGAYLTAEGNKST